MTNDYYETLGIAPNATEAEIKKAYFRLIRKYSPESDPEMFQKIRYAYEQLKDGKAVKLQQPEGMSFSEPFAEKMMQQIQRRLQAGDYQAAKATCEEAWKRYPKDIQFLYYLVITQRQCGNTGKAVKNAELLVKTSPEEMLYWKELAFSYYDRGFLKKAFAACKKTYELGCRETEFVFIYTDGCLHYQEYETCWEILINLLRQEQKWSKEDMPYLFEAIFRLLFLLSYVDQSSFCFESLDFCEQLLKKYRIYVPSYAEEINNALGMILVRGRCGRELKNRIKQLFELLIALCTDSAQKNRLTDSQAQIMLCYLEKYEQFPEVLLQGYDAFCMEMDDSYLKKFMQLDMKLCMIEERKEILARKEVLQQELPEYYQQLKDFMERLENEHGIIHLKEALKKDYDRMIYDFDGGYYYELYPEERRGVSQILITNGIDDMPYVREGKKIGRNDPCPCGSGKKYKMCCMRK